MALWPGLGSSSQGSELERMFIDQMAGMGDFITNQPGTLAWVEGLVCARMLNAAINFVRLVTSQLDPANATIFLSRWQEIYLCFLNRTNTETYIQQLNLETNTLPSINNITLYITEQLQGTFLDLQFIPIFASPWATRAPPPPGTLFNSPISYILVHVWQLRDNNDNLLMPTNYFMSVINTYQNVTSSWIPENSALENVIFTNAGGDGYGNMNLDDGYNVPVTGILGGTTLTSTLSSANSTFDRDFEAVISGQVPFQPIEIVDDLNVVHTYYVNHVNSNTQVVLTMPLVNAITARTYRTYGFLCNISGAGYTACN